MKCKVCGHEFELKKENKYIVDEYCSAVIGCDKIVHHECFDCPDCGCQNPVNTRVENTPQLDVKLSTESMGLDEFSEMMKTQKLYCENT